jgi:tRNA-Thr(GGU) m(6)t(6)A37 methyltransferase TsaA
MELSPVGKVRSVKGDISEIEIAPELADGLYRLEEDERILVLFHFDRSEGYDLKVHPRGDPNNPLVGVFASRSPRRPNPIGATVVRLLRIDGNVLTVSGLDAWEGTPVVDIKPDRRRDGLELGCSMVKTN